MRSQADMKMARRIADAIGERDETLEVEGLEWAAHQAAVWLRNGKVASFEEAVASAIARIRNLQEQKTRRLAHDTGAG